MKFRVFTGCLMVLMLAVSFNVSAFTVAEQSKYRSVDTTGDSLKGHLAGFFMPGVGVGNYIFSTNPLPHAKDQLYSNVKSEFSADEVVNTGFHAREFLPGRTGEIIKFIESQKAGYKFVKKYTRIEYTAPDGRYEKMDAEDRLNQTTQTWSSRLTDFHPANDYPNFPVIRSVQANTGKHTIKMTTYLLFSTAESKTVSEWRNNQLVTQKVPVSREVVISTGKAVITN
jgi:hypothetical protein